MTTDEQTPQVATYRGSGQEEEVSEDFCLVRMGATTPAPRETPEQAKARKAAEDHVFRMHSPKMSIMVRLARVANVEDTMSMMGVFDDFIDSALDPDDRAYLRSLLADPDLRDWDYGFLVYMLGLAREQWFPDRPTGRSSGSAGPPARSGKRSTVRSR